MGKNYIPRSISKFTEYIKIAMKKALENHSAYGIPHEAAAAMLPTFDRYLAAEALAADPDTATTGNRRERDSAKNELTALWRAFINEYIRYNARVPEADLEVFGIKRSDGTRTPAGVPDETGVVVVKRVGAFRFEAQVLDSATGKSKNPKYATGSYLYVAITELNTEPLHEDEFRKRDFASNNKHVLDFAREQVGKEAHIFARYSNPHGKEGPAGATETIVIN